MVNSIDWKPEPAEKPVSLIVDQAKHADRRHSRNRTSSSRYKCVLSPPPSGA